VIAETDASRARAMLALKAIADAFVEAVAAAGDTGAPAGVMFAACSRWVTLAQFEQVLAGLVVAKKLRKDGHRYFIA
jgi:hypothetical protein